MRNCEITAMCRDVCNICKILFRRVCEICIGSNWQLFSYDVQREIYALHKLGAKNQFDVI